MAAGRTPKQTEDAAQELADGLFVVIDEETEEVLIRSFLKHDGLLQKPNVTKAMVTAYGQVYSMALKGVIVHELNRLHDKFPDWRGFVLPEVQALLGNRSVNPSELVSNRSPNPSEKKAPLLTTNYLLLATDNHLPAIGERSLESEFERAYEWWPKKTEKKRSLAKFLSLAKTMNVDALVADIIRFGKAYTDTTDKRYVPALVVWLNGERWNDEPPVADTAAINAQWDAAMREQVDPCAGGHKWAVDGSCVRYPCPARRGE
ncbi:hypothetical protein [Microbacterium sp. p3-SID131]|uniref:hypothetical protein n=1 Tax=Microbacterium sp. p3-SID131 TaxID=2916215 RepID=UPI0021A39DA0|nr:hypothetical protein [Microbacterium sp. p3-SID131]MCT1363334.1 hypothetical protein [Microbacterium sp. p3-SID131]